MHTAKSLKAKKLILYFHTTTKNFKKKLFQHAFLVLITSLLKLRELGQYFKNSKKIIFFLLISGITNLYVKRIPDIEKGSSFIDVRTVRFYSIR
jgi:hypothetical protein